LPARDLDGVIPGADADADAERLAARVDEIIAELDVLARDRGGDAAEIFERVRPARRIGDQRLLQRLARVERFELREFAIARAHEVGGAAQDAAALGAGHGGPLALRPLGRLERAVDQRRRRLVQPRDDLARRRIAALERRACGILGERAVDMMARLGLCSHFGLPTRKTVTRYRAAARKSQGSGRRRDLAEHAGLTRERVEALPD